MAKIVTLGPVDSPSSTITFEQAFGEFSEVRGKGRARRAKRVADRQQKRKERKLGRISARDEVKAARAETRIGRRASRKAQRQEMRDAQQQARQGRRDTRVERNLDRRDLRTERRMGRKEMRNPEEENLQNGLDTGVDQEMTDQATPMGAEQGGYDSGSEQGGYADQGSDQGGYDGGSDQGGYDESGSYGDEGGFADYDRVGAGPQQGSYQGGGVESSFPEDSMPYDETGSEGYDEGEDTGGDYGEESGYLQDYGASDDYNFDGVMGAEDRFSEMSDGSRGKQVNVDARVQDITDKMAWNQELISRLEAKRKANPNQAQGISRQIVMRKQRMKELQEKLDAFSNAWGEYSCADGGSEMELKRRSAQVLHAKRRSHQKRQMARRGQATRVKAGLNPSFGPNRIVVPGKSNADGTPTGINGLDLMNDFDAPRVREIQLGADGSQSSSKGLGWGAVIGAVAVGAILFWAVEKYKIVK